MQHRLKRGQAVVIVGPQGSGKSILARQIAQKHGGKVVEVSAHEIEGHFGVDNVLACRPDVIICDEFPSHVASRTKLKSLLTNDSVMANRKHQQAIEVPSPHLIFCTIDSRAIESDRRYKVITVDRQPAPAT